jgi:transposase
MARPAIAVRRLTPAERRKLNALFRHPPNPRVHERALAIRLSSQGASPRQVVRTVGRGRSTIWRWIKDFNERGLDALFMGTSPGPPPKADADVCAALSQAVEANPHDLGYAFTRWTAPLLVEHLRQTVHVELSVDTVYRALHRLGYRYLRPKLDLAHKQDRGEIRRAKRQKRAAQKKSRPAPVVVLSRFSTRRNSTSTPSSADSGRAAAPNRRSPPPGRTAG